jgi:hypothetical protein
VMQNICYCFKKYGSVILMSDVLGHSFRPKRQSNINPKTARQLKENILYYCFKWAK